MPASSSGGGAACRAASGRAGAPGDAALPEGCGVLAAAGPSRPDLRSRRADAVGRWRSEPSARELRDRGRYDSVGDAPLVVEPP